MVQKKKRALLSNNKFGWWAGKLGWFGGNTKCTEKVEIKTSGG